MCIGVHGEVCVCVGHRRREARGGEVAPDKGPATRTAGGGVPSAHGAVEQRDGDPMGRVLEPGDGKERERGQSEFSRLPWHVKWLAPTLALISHFCD